MNMRIPTASADQPTQFEFDFDGTPIRGISTNGKPVFVAADLAKALHYRDAANMMRIVKPREKGTHSVSNPPSGRRSPDRRPFSWAPTRDSGSEPRFGIRYLPFGDGRASSSSFHSGG